MATPQKANPQRPAMDDPLDVAVDVAQPILEMLSSGLRLVPIPAMDLIPEGLSTILKTVKHARANKRAREAFLNEVRELAAVIKKLGVQLGASEDQLVKGGRNDKTTNARSHSCDLSSGIDDLQSTITTLMGRARQLAGVERNTWYGKCWESIKRVLLVSRDAEILAEMGKILNAAVVRFQANAVGTINRAVRENQLLLQKADEDRTLEKLCSTSASYRTVSQPKAGLMKGTRVVLLEEIDQWSTGRLPSPADTKRVFFLSGGMGVGKSCVAYEFCKRLSSSTPPAQVRLGASVFFDRALGAMTPQLLFPSLARQLAESQPVLRPHIVAAAREYVKVGQSQLPEYSYRELLVNPLSLAREQMLDQPHVILVVDGLDECVEQSLLQECLKQLLGLVGTHSWLHLFVASRPEPRIVTTLNQAVDLVYRHELNHDLAEDGDVAAFLKAKVPKSSYLESNPDELERLIRRAAGLFIFARVAVNVLESDYYLQAPEEGFRIVLSEEIGLENMDALYLGILQAAYPSKVLRESPRQHARLLSFLHVAALLEEEISVKPLVILADAVYDCSSIHTRLSGKAEKEKALAENEILDIITRLASILYIEPTTDLLRPVHISFYEFLLSDRCNDADFRIFPGEGHSVLVSAAFSLFSPWSIQRLLQSTRPIPGAEGIWANSSAASTLAQCCVGLVVRLYAGRISLSEEYASTLEVAKAGTWIPYCARFVMGSQLHCTIFTGGKGRFAVGEYSWAKGMFAGYIEGLVDYSRWYLWHMLANRGHTAEEICEAVRDKDIKTSYPHDDYELILPGLYYYPVLESEEEHRRRRSAIAGGYEEVWKGVWEQLMNDSDLQESWYDCVDRDHVDTVVAVWCTWSH